MMKDFYLVAMIDAVMRGRRLELRFYHYEGDEIDEETEERIGIAAVTEDGFFSFLVCHWLPGAKDEARHIEFAEAKQLVEEHFA